MRLRLLLAVLFLVSALACSATAADTVRLVMLGDTTLFGYNMPPSEALPERLEAALSTPERPVEILKSHNIDTSKSALIWLITKTAKAVLADPDGAALILSVGYWDCGVMMLDQTAENLGKVMAVFRSAGIPILLIETQPRTFCGVDYNATYAGIFPELSKEHGALLYVDETPPPPDERPEGVNYITRPVPFEELLPHVEELLDRLSGT